MKLKISLLVILLGAAVITAGCTQKQQQQITNTITNDTQGKMEKQAVQEKEMKEMTYQFKGNLTDVTKGLIVGTITTKGNASGTAMASFDDSQYSLVASFEGLPDPANGEFYEGWVVRKNPLSVTGKISDSEAFNARIKPL